jgi:plastocyanin
MNTGSPTSKRTLSHRLGLLAACAALTAAPVVIGSEAQATTHAPAAGHATATAAKRATTVIRIKNFAFHTLRTVAPGATVKVVNRDGTTHTVTSNKGLFSVRVPAGKTRTFTAPDSAGKYRFHCKIHTDMHGHLTVR